MYSSSMCDGDVDAAACAGTMVLHVARSLAPPMGRLTRKLAREVEGCVASLFSPFSV